MMFQIRHAACGPHSFSTCPSSQFSTRSSSTLVLYQDLYKWASSNSVWRKRTMSSGSRERIWRLRSLLLPNPNIKPLLQINRNQLSETSRIVVVSTELRQFIRSTIAVLSPGSKSNPGIWQLQCIRSPYSDRRRVASEPEMSFFISWSARNVDEITSRCCTSEYAFETVVIGIWLSVNSSGSRRISSLYLFSSPPDR